MNEFDDKAPDSVKHRRGYTYAAALIVLFVGFLLLVTCGDSSEYTFHPERFNVKILIGIGSVIALGVLYYFIFEKRKKK